MIHLICLRLDRVEHLDADLQDDPHEIPRFLEKRIQQFQHRGIVFDLRDVAIERLNDGVAVGGVEQPDAGKCGSKVQLTGTLEVDGPATVRYRFLASVGGLIFQGGDGGELKVDAGGSATLTKEATFLRPLKGQLWLQAIVQGVNGHDGPMKKSAQVPFQVTCAGK